jgi:phosphohistidine swiveling domain-containing protein
MTTTPPASPSALPRCVPLARLDGEAAGGKAEGLRALARAGLPVPDAFVVLDAAPGALPPDLGAAYRRLGGGPVAVRSSALGEDGEAASFAGQYESILDVSGEEALARAVEACLASAASARAAAYRRTHEATAGPVAMAVVVQRMVDAAAAGVVFTADPVSGRRDRMVVNAARGRGDALVSGRIAADEYVLSPGGDRLEARIAGDSAVLGEAALRTLAAGAARAARAAGRPLDLEWAIDRAGACFWLQARPITTLGADDATDDAPPGDAVYTRFNVGEVIPGAVTPLTWSVVGRAGDHGLQDLFVRLGTQARHVDRVLYFARFSGHVFLNATAMYAASARIPGVTKEVLDLGLAGRPIPETPVPAPAPLAARLATGLRFLALALGAEKRVERLARTVEALAIEPAAEDPAGVLAATLRCVPALREAWAVHTATSLASSALHGAVLRLLGGGPVPGPEAHAEAARLLTDVRGIESADVIGALDALADRLAADPAAHGLARLRPEEALAWLRSPEAGPHGAAFARFLALHGHRGIRETELRQKDWSEDPATLVASLQTALRGRLARPPGPRGAAGSGAATPARGRIAGAALALLVARAKRAIRLRERSKSLSVRAVRVVKRGFARLAALLVAAGKLPDEDAIWFLTQDELRALVASERRDLARLIAVRRARHEADMALTMPEISLGPPAPEDPEAAAAPPGSTIRGTPVSRGRAAGLARVVRAPEDAEGLRPGEVLVLPFIDVGWTPLFSVAAGLATEIGSPLSHGAVVAREYGLPAVVNLPGATRLCRTGDRVVLDAVAGTLTVLERGPAAPREGEGNRGLRRASLAR